ncbi:MAG: hypothetical protein HY360_08000 [Verrucomicrobia bacterium]|nr:hypothetical protein [Verrucomicrobiota bacterium]
MNFKAITGFLGQYYERIIAVVVMLILVVFSSYLVMHAGSIRSQLKQDETVKPPAQPARPVNTHDFKQSIAMLETPPSWCTNVHRVFIAPPMKILDPNDPVPTRYDDLAMGEMTTSEGFPYNWLKKYELPTDQPVSDTDPDNDGFTVREEFDAKTDPKNPDSKPDVILKLRTVRLVQKAFPFLFNGIAEGEGGMKFSILRKDGSKNYYVKMGELVPAPDAPGFKVVNYAPKIKEQPSSSIKNYVEKIDISELTLQKGDDAPLTLIKGKAATTEDLFAVLRFLIENREIEVGEKTIFELQNTQYQVIRIKKLDDMRPEVIIKRHDTGQEYTLMPLSQTDFRRPTSTSPSPTRTPSPASPIPNPIAPMDPRGFPTGPIPPR